MKEEKSDGGEGVKEAEDRTWRLGGSGGQEELRWEAGLCGSALRSDTAAPL